MRPGRWHSSPCPGWPAPAATCTSSRATPTPCAAGDGACAGPSPPGTPPGLWPTPAYQAVKYRNRYGWTHRDLLRKVHAKAEGPLNELFAWVTQGTLPSDDPDLRLVHAFEQAKTADSDALSALIREHRMSWEMVPAEMMDRREVWQALSEDMPVTAYVRNLATMTRLGVISHMDTARACEVLGRIGTGRGRVHPIGVLSALLTYRSGKGVRGQHSLGAGVAGGGRAGHRLRAVLRPGAADRQPAVPRH